MDSPKHEHPQIRYHPYKEEVQNLLRVFESHEPKMRKEDMPIHSREYESLQTNILLISTQPVDKQVLSTLKEHPNAIIDNQDSEFSSFRLLCHLSTDQGCCLNPFSMFRITKDKFKWSYLGGFIWVTYIPCCYMVEELDGQKYIEIGIHNNCPGLFRQNLGVRLLYEQEVEEFRNSIYKCVTSFFDYMDLISQFVTNENGNASHADHVHQTETTENWDSQQQENPGNSGVDFHRAMIYNSCFPANIDVLDWFSHHSIDQSVTMQLLSTNPNNGGGSWIGLALYAYFSDLRDPSNFGPQLPHNYLTCHMETERISLKPVHQYRIINDEYKKTSSNRKLIWVSYIPRSWFGDQLIAADTLRLHLKAVNKACMLRSVVSVFYMSNQQGRG
ncbi:hypothetical protein FNV43_RR27105 [Rhamnella rubrinervis]|uniref:Uncharacterized protein n=1 Tax=Rhamnella rubrinervis TaxID=2594499 RepID=A0A8K0DK02_9ROSA|nr:hypothetical protein FNV43_RR27105 [Rhamnella rubrinervis]